VIYIHVTGDRCLKVTILPFPKRDHWRSALYSGLFDRGSAATAATGGATILLSTCILECLTASLCDAVTEQHNSQQILERLEQANLFVVSLDNKRQWYRYHALFAEALCYQFWMCRTGYKQ
jgi:hypothetical protein